MDKDLIFTGVIGLAGTVIGASISFLASIFLTSKEAKIRVQEKIFDKRIDAHEALLGFCQEMRTTVSTHLGDSQRNAITYPKFLQNRASYAAFTYKLYNVLRQNSFWIDIELFRHLNYLQDYLENLSSSINMLDENKLPEIGIYIKQDFIDMALELENETLKFFEKDIYSINLKIRKGHHKFPREKTIKKFENTCLHRQQHLINALYETK